MVNADYVRHAEPQLRAETLMPRGGSVSRMRARTGRTQIAVVGENTRCRRLARQEAVRIHRDGRYITFQIRECAAGVLVRVARDRWHVIIWAAAFIKGEEQG